jgi:hypothetical protein
MEYKTVLPDNGGRRSRKDRRKYICDFCATERRKGNDRRSGVDRRGQHRYVIREGISGLELSGTV